MSVHEHKSKATQPVRCKVITVSDTRTKETDKSGALMIQLLKEHEMQVASYEIVKTIKRRFNKRYLPDAVLRTLTLFSQTAAPELQNETSQLKPFKC